jgi:hypothetical protein
MIYYLFFHFSSEIQRLDQDHKRLERTCEVAQKMGTSLQETHDRFLTVLKRTAEQEKEYEFEMVTLRGLFLEFS